MIPITGIILLISLAVGFIAQPAACTVYIGWRRFNDRNKPVLVCDDTIKSCKEVYGRNTFKKPGKIIFNGTHYYFPAEAGYYEDMDSSLLVSVCSDPGLTQCKLIKPNFYQSFYLYEMAYYGGMYYFIGNQNRIWMCSDPELQKCTNSGRDSIAGEANSLTIDGKYAYVTMTAFKGGPSINTIAACDRSLKKCSTKLSVASFREDLVAWQIQKVDGKYYILLGSNVVDTQPEYYFLVCSDPELRKESCKFSHKKSAITNGVKKGLEFAAFTYDQKTKDFLITASENGSITFDRRKQRVIRVNKITNKQSIVDFSQYGFDPETNWWPAEYISSIN